MATKRKRGNSWEFVVKRAGLLEKPLSLTFADEGEGDEYCRRLESLLDRGIIPGEHKPKLRIITLEHLIREYLREVNLSQKDTDILHTILPVVGLTACANVDANWVDQWVTRMKREDNYAPATIRAKVGALARCCDWGKRKKLIELADSPFRSLPDGYSQYTDLDTKLAGELREDVERDRRLEHGEEARILAVIQAGVLPRKQRPYTIEHQAHVETLFRLALETAMRMREMYTLTTDQIDLAKRTAYLDKTKNGDKRQVPLSSVAVALLKPYLDSPGPLFPWLAEQGGNLKLTSNYLSKLFAHIFEAAGCGDLHFHDLRAEATARIYERTTLSDVEIARITGHRDIKVLIRRYARLRGSTLAERMW